MRTILILLRKDIANFVRFRAALVLTFLVPVTLIYIFGQVWGLNRKESGPNGIRLAVVNLSDNPGALMLVDALKAEKAFYVWTKYKLPDGTERAMTEEDARKLIHNNDLHFALIIPADLIGTEQFGLHLKILSNPQNTIETQMVNGLLQKTIFSNVPQLLGQALQDRARNFIGADRLKQFNGTVARAVANAFGGDKEAIERRIESGDFGFSPGSPAAGTQGNDPALRRLDAPGVGETTAKASGTSSKPADLFARVVRIEGEQVVGKDVKSPLATTIIGGQAVMFLLFALSGGAAAFFDEKNAGKFQRLLAGPVSRAQLLWGRFLFGVLLGLTQLTMLFIAGQLLFGVDVLSHLGLLLLVCCASAAACSAFGMLIAAVAPDAQAASGLSTFLVLTMSATGGAWFPISLMPEFMQKIGKLTLVYWSIEGFGRVLWAGNSLVELLPTLGILLGIAFAVMTVAIWRLNHKKIFD